MADVTPIRKDSGEQLSFNGMPVEETAFKLVGTTRLYTDQILKPKTNVIGRFEGRVKGWAYDSDTGRLVNVIEVLDASIED